MCIYYVCIKLRHDVGITKYFNEIINNFNENNQDSKSVFLFKLMDDKVKYFLFNGFVNTVYDSGNVFKHKLLSVDTVYSGLVQLKNDVNELPLDTLIDKHDKLNSKQVLEKTEKDVKNQFFP